MHVHVRNVRKLLVKRNYDLIAIILLWTFDKILFSKKYKKSDLSKRIIIFHNSECNTGQCLELLFIVRLTTGCNH